MIRPIRTLTKALGTTFTRWQIRTGSEDAKRRHRAEQLASTLLSEFHRLGFTRRVAAGKKKTRRQRVCFEEPLLLTHDELWCPIDLRRLPTGVRTDDLRDDAVLRSLEDRCGAAVRPDYLPNGKLCFVVRIRGAKFPESFSINAFKMPPEAPMLAFPLGMDADGEHASADIADLKHLLIVGATGSGKTTLIHALLYTLIARNSDQDLELWLIDLKNGAELGRYDALLNTKSNPRGMVRQLAHEPDKAIDVLNLALKEIQRRNDLMRQFSASNLDDLAHLSGQRLRRIVVVVDEIAMLMLNRDKIGKYSTGSWAENLMTRIASLGRSAGVHLVIASQMLQKDVLSGMILANFENRIAFSCADWRKSQLAIETSEADGLPVGRAIFRREGKTKEVQTCLITPQQTRLEIERIRRHGPAGGLGEDEAATTFIRDAKLLLSVACERLGGEFSRAKLLKEDGVRGVISQERYAEIARRLEQDGVLDPGRSRQPRRVARGYFNRPQLLELLYAPNREGANGTPTADAPDARGWPAVGGDAAQQDAQEQGPAREGFAGRGLGSDSTCRVDDEGPEPDIGAAFGRLLGLDSPAPEPAAPEPPDELEE